MQTTKWIISVRRGKQRKDLEFRTKEGETPKDTYRRVKRNAQKIEEQLNGDGIVEIISRTVAFKPKGTSPHRERYWCPYCNKWRVFGYDDYIGVNRCNICGISDRDYYVRKYNDLWKKEYIQGKIKK